MKKKIILGVAVLTLLCGCGRTIPTLSDGKEAVVKFKDGSMISVDDFYKELKNESINKLVEMIDLKILEDSYKDKLAEAKAYSENYIESLKNYYVDDDGNYDETQLKNVIQTYYGYDSIESFQEYIRVEYLRDLAKDEYAKSIITDKEIEKYYKDEVKPNREVYHIQIVPEVKDNMTDDEKKEKEEEALNKAKSLIAKLKKGEDFATLAKENSDDEATKEKGGYLGSINKGFYGSDEFDAEVYKLKVDSYSTTPIKTTKGYEIVYVKSEGEKKSLEESRDSIIETLATKKQGEDLTVGVNAMIELRKKNGVDIIDTELDNKYDAKIEDELVNAKANSSY